MEAVEFALRIFPFNETLQQELATLEQQGWVMVPGLAPAVSYVVMRKVAEVTPSVEPASFVEPPAGAGFGSMTIDDTKIHIYRNGQLVGENDG